MNAKIINILDLIETIGEEEVQSILSDFSCPLNAEIEKFVWENSIDFAKRKMSITFLVFAEDGLLVGIFALTHKAIELDARQMSGTIRKKMNRFAYLDDNTGCYMVSAFLIGQFGKNFHESIENGIEGNELMKSVMTKLLSVQHEVGGGVIYLDCEEKEQLLSFYGNEVNRFRRCGEHVSKTDGMRYVRMMRLF